MKAEYSTWFARFFGVQAYGLFARCERMIVGVLLKLSWDPPKRTLQWTCHFSCGNATEPMVDFLFHCKPRLEDNELILFFKVPWEVVSEFIPSRRIRLIPSRCNLMNWKLHHCISNLTKILFTSLVNKIPQWSQSEIPSFFIPGAWHRAQGQTLRYRKFRLGRVTCLSQIRTWNGFITPLKTNIAPKNGGFQ